MRGRIQVWMLTTSSKWKLKPSQGQDQSKARETTGVQTEKGLLQAVASLDSAPQVTLLCARPSPNPARHIDFVSWLHLPSGKCFLLNYHNVIGWVMQEPSR